MASKDSISTDGWTAVPRAQSKILSHVDTNAPAKFSVNDIQVPKSDVVNKAYEYAKHELPEQTFNHSMRVYYYGECMNDRALIVPDVGNVTCAFL